MSRGLIGGRVVLVTGANRGIGLEVCRHLALQGDLPVLGCRDRRRGDAAQASLERDGLKADVVHLDVTQQRSIDAAVRHLGDRYGVLDALVNNAAVNYDTWQRASDPDFRTVEDTWQTNVLGAWRTTAAVVPLLTAAPRPRVVNVSSEAGSLTGMGSGAPAYSVTKAALNALTRVLAAELRGRVLVNAVCPGWVATDMGGRGGRPVEEGAHSVLWAVNLPEDGPTGGFFRDGRPLPW